MNRDKLIGVIYGIALGNGEEAPIIKMLMDRFGITDDEMLIVTDEMSPILAEIFNEDTRSV